MGQRYCYKHLHNNINVVVHESNLSYSSSFDLHFFPFPLLANTDFIAHLASVIIINNLPYLHNSWSIFSDSEGYFSPNLASTEALYLQVYGQKYEIWLFHACYITVKCYQFALTMWLKQQVGCSYAVDFCSCVVVTI